MQAGKGGRQHHPTPELKENQSGRRAAKGGAKLAKEAGNATTAQKRGNASKGTKRRPRRTGSGQSPRQYDPGRREPRHAMTQTQRGEEKETRRPPASRQEAAETQTRKRESEASKGGKRTSRGVSRAPEAVPPGITSGKASQRTGTKWGKHRCQTQNTTIQSASTTQKEA